MTAAIGVSAELAEYSLGIFGAGASGLSGLSFGGFAAASDQVNTPCDRRACRAVTARGKLRADAAGWFRAVNGFSDRD